MKRNGKCNEEGGVVQRWR